jgi:hypothetical protein
MAAEDSCHPKSENRAWGISKALMEATAVRKPKVYRRQLSGVLFIKWTCVEWQSVSWRPSLVALIQVSSICSAFRF